MLHAIDRERTVFMETRVHPSAIIESGAELAEEVSVGPYAYIGPDVAVGRGCKIGHHATVTGPTTMGEGNTVFPYACIGERTQDLKYTGGRPGTTIGDRNTFREFSTIHAATNDGDRTVVGSDNHFLAYTHIAHDCRVGNHVIISNNGTLAGHVTLEDRVVIGGLTAVHQFCRIGRFAMLGGCGKVVQDVPPFMIADGSPATVRTINKVGMERGGFTAEEVNLARRCFKLLYREGLNRGQALDQLREMQGKEPSEIVEAMIVFIERSKRGLV